MIPHRTASHDTCDSETPSSSPRRRLSDDGKHVPSSLCYPTKPELSSDPKPPARRTPVFPSREDCWSEDATRTLIDAWGRYYLEHNRGHLSQKHWQEVADAVNAVHITSGKHRRTDIQCQNRIDTVKKRYKIEKSNTVESNGRYKSTWPHFERLDSLIGDSFPKTQNNNANGHHRNLRPGISRSPELSPSPTSAPATLTKHRKSLPAMSHHQEKYPAVGPVGPSSKRSAPTSVAERNFSLMAAAAAAVEAAEHEKDDDEDDSTQWDWQPPAVDRTRKPSIEGFKMLAEAITRLGEIYQKVETAKQQQILELEKEKMLFAKDLEIERMGFFMESLVGIEELKRATHRSGNS
ncbi:Transcription factor GT-2 [Handroanthus impetiginosus]|uniref:Transcription factor GT-2 n=1 Tax=Handroanthus impetiginosus TaxID=429701 RepID=A0A2G9GKC0_9LAMI|nr:Transcription factor GT-2 [Handroanthus impetiginosus]